MVNGHVLISKALTALLSCNYGFVRQLLSANLEAEGLRQWLFAHAVLNNRRECFMNSILELIDFKDSEKELIYAIIKGNVRSVESLLKSGVKFDGAKWSKYLPELYENVFKNSDTRNEMLTLFREYRQLDPSFKNKNGENILFWFIKRVVKKNSQDVVKTAEILVDAGVSVQEVEHNEHISPLLCVVDKGNLSLVSFLIQRGADIHHKSKSEKSAVFLAAFAGDIDLVDLLISHGANINDKDCYGMTALHRQCSPMIGHLIRKGADICAENVFGFTPLSFLDPEVYYYESVSSAFIRGFAKITHENLPISKTDVKIIEENSKLRIYFKECSEELEKMTDTEFFAPYSFYSVLKKSMSLKKLSHLTKNEELAFKFEDNLRKFCCYKEDLKFIWNEAIQVRRDSEAKISRLNSLFRNFFPDFVIRKLAENFCQRNECYLMLLKIFSYILKIVEIFSI